MRLRFAVCVCLVAAGYARPVLAIEAGSAAAHVDALFSPGGGCEERVIQEIDKAQKTIRMQAYTFTSTVVAKALNKAQARGVDCEVILDKWNRTEKFSAAGNIASAGVPCFIDDLHTIANNKVILIDDATLVTGSYNFTRAAEASNAENLLIITGMPELMKSYAANYAKHKEHAKPYASSPTTQPSITGQNVSNNASAMKVNAPSVNGANAKSPSGGATPALAGKVYVTPNGKRYHRADCDALHGAGKEIDRSELRGKYTPCPKCHPG